MLETTCCSLLNDYENMRCERNTCYRRNSDKTLAFVYDVFVFSIKFHFDFI